MTSSQVQQLLDHRNLEPCLARLGTMPEDKPSFIAEVNAINDVNTLRQMLIQKERDRQSIANDLDVAARLGLVISETNEAIQIKLAQLERENEFLRQELERLSSHHSHSTSHRDDPSRFSSDKHDDNDTSIYSDDHFTHLDHTSDSRTAAEERLYLTQELEQARRELNKFRKEMDGLSAQLNDMASEMVDSRARVSMYAKRLAEVEHKLATTREMNTNLQMLLEKALTSQKQSSSNTTHLVRNIQADLARVMNENDQLRARIADLENQQIESEEKLAMMVAQAKEYASLLEQAQDTIHSLSEPRLSDDDTLSNGVSTASVSSYWDGGKETEITKGPVFSAEFRQEMQKEIERNLNLRNEIRHRIITYESISSDKKKTQEGLKYLLADRGDNATSSSSSAGGSGVSGLASVLANNTASLKRDQSEESAGNSNSQQQQPQPSVPSQTINTLRPANFLTGFGSFGTENGLVNGMGTTNFITRGIPVTSRNFMTFRGSSEPSISTRFFQRIAMRFDEYEKRESNRR